MYKEREGIYMKKRRWMALALACTMIFTAGCQKGGKETTEVPVNKETKESQAETAKRLYHKSNQTGRDGQDGGSKHRKYEEPGGAGYN